MPSTKVTNQATAANAMTGLEFEDIPAGGALLSFYAAGVSNNDTVDLRAAGDQLLVLANPNIEISADVLDVGRDQLLFQEPVKEGKVFIPITVTTAMNWLLVLEYVQ